MSELDMYKEQLKVLEEKEQEIRGKIIALHKQSANYVEGGIYTNDHDYSEYICRIDLDGWGFENVYDGDTYEPGDKEWVLKRNPSPYAVMKARNISAETLLEWAQDNGVAFSDYLEDNAS